MIDQLNGVDRAAADAMQQAVGAGGAFGLVGNERALARLRQREARARADADNAGGRAARRELEAMMAGFGIPMGDFKVNVDVDNLAFNVVDRRLASLRALNEIKAIINSTPIIEEGQIVTDGNGRAVTADWKEMPFVQALASRVQPVGKSVVGYQGRIEMVGGVPKILEMRQTLASVKDGTAIISQNLIQHGVGGTSTFNKAAAEDFAKIATLEFETFGTFNHIGMTQYFAANLKKDEVVHIIGKNGKEAFTVTKGLIVINGVTEMDKMGGIASYCARASGAAVQMKTDNGMVFKS
ncbi:MAG: hypothetical protein Q8O57_12620, partial [Kiritimatiellota bacterium]|nr:hypothetical protein [Kiritimatiellota bacterium]